MRDTVDPGITQEKSAIKPSNNHENEASLTVYGQKIEGKRGTSKPKLEENVCHLSTKRYDNVTFKCLNKALNCNEFITKGCMETFRVIFTLSFTTVEYFKIKAFYLNFFISSLT